MTLLDEGGLRTTALDPVVAACLGDAPGEEGAKLLAEALDHGRYRVAVQDLVYCLARGRGTQFSKRFLQQTGQSADAFVAALESGLDVEPDQAELPMQLKASTASPLVLTIFDAAEALARKARKSRVDDTVLTLALLQHAEDELADLLRAWVGEDNYVALAAQLQRSLTKQPQAELFDPQGQLSLNHFSVSGQRFIKRLLEDAGSLGAKSISLRHLLYTLLGDEQSLLSRCLFMLGADVKRELLAPVARQLVQPGKKRHELIAQRDSFLETTVRVFERAQKLAAERDGRINSSDITLAFADRAERELARMLVGISAFSLDDLKSVLADADTATENEEEETAQQMPIREIESRMKQVICGQNQAIERVMPWIKRLRFGLTRDGRPAGVFLFLGPTGTGKTQLAKELARYVFGDEEQIIFLEMGQFKTKESMSGFIGAPPGYTGYGEGILTNGLRDKPECVVLFDEIEKADTQVFDTLLRFADEGLISDPAGPVRDGRKCLIVMTTNAGQQWLRQELQANPNIVQDPKLLGERLFEAAMSELAAKGFRPEFLGRLDERITYLPFDLGSCRRIVDLVLSKEINRILEQKQVAVEVDEKAREILADFTFARTLDEGARGAPRAINEFIITPLVDLLTDMIEKGGDIAGLRVLASGIGKERVAIELA